VDDQLQELTYFGLKFTFRHRPIIRTEVRRGPATAPAMAKILPIKRTRSVGEVFSSLRIRQVLERTNDSAHTD